LVLLIYFIFGNKDAEFNTLFTQVYFGTHGHPLHNASCPPILDRRKAGNLNDFLLRNAAGMRRAIPFLVPVNVSCLQKTISILDPALETTPS